MKELDLDCYLVRQASKRLPYLDQSIHSADIGRPGSAIGTRVILRVADRHLRNYAS